MSLSWTHFWTRSIPLSVSEAMSLVCPPIEGARAKAVPTIAPIAVSSAAAAERAAGKRNRRSKKPARGASTLVMTRARATGRMMLQANLTISPRRSEEHTSELQSLMRISYAVFCLKKKIQQKQDKEQSRIKAPNKSYAQK